MRRETHIQRKPAVLSRVHIATSYLTTAKPKVTSDYVQRTSQGSRILTEDMKPYGIRTRVAGPNPRKATGPIIHTVRRLLSWLESR